MTDAGDAVLVAVPADLLTAAAQLIAELPAGRAASVYLALLQCKPVDERITDDAGNGSSLRSLLRGRA